MKDVLNSRVGVGSHCITDLLIKAQILSSTVNNKSLAWLEFFFAKLSSSKALSCLSFADILVKFCQTSCHRIDFYAVSLNVSHANFCRFR